MSISSYGETYEEGVFFPSEDDCAPGPSCGIRDGVDVEVEVDVGYGCGLDARSRAVGRGGAAVAGATAVDMLSTKRENCVGGVIPSWSVRSAPYISQSAVDKQRART